MEHCIIPSMPKVVFYWWVFYIFLWGQVLCVFHSIGVSTSPCLPSKNLNTCACVMCTILFNTLFSPPCLTPWIHTKSTFEKGVFVGFWTWWIVIWEFNPCLYTRKKCAPTISLFFISPWLLMKYISQYFHVGVIITTNIKDTQDLGTNLAIPTC